MIRTVSAVAVALLLLLAGLAAAPGAKAQALPGTGGAPEATPAAGADAVERLLEVLRDDAARAALVERLEAEVSATAAEAPPVEAPNVAQRIAGATAGAAAAAAGQVLRIGAELGRLGELGTRVAAWDHGRYRDELVALGLTVAATLSAYYLLSLAVRTIARRVDPPLGARYWRRARAVAIAFGARVVALALAWALGYALAAGLFGDGRPSGAQSLYLNAFAVYGLVRAALRTVASPDADDEPSLSQLAPGAQAVIYRSLRAVAGTVIQGFLFLLPLAQAWFGFAAARPLRTLLATLAAAVSLVAIRRILTALDRARGHRPVARDAGAAMAETAQGAWRRLWPPLAVAYVLYSWFVTVSRPAMAGEIVLGGTLYSAIGLALLLGGLRLARGASRLRAPLPRPVVAAVPRLGPRADAIATAVGWALAAALAVLAVALFVAGWTALELAGLFATDWVQGALWRLLSAGVVALGVAIVWAVVASWIDHRLALELPGRNVTARSRTLLALFRNAFTIAIAILGTMITLSQLGIDIAPLIAGAGVIGLAIGFGAQKLVQDIITGVFIQLENAMNEGDVVGVAGITGGVEKITIRSVKLRTLDGAAHIVPFSSVDTVTNLTRDFSYHVAEIGAAYKEKVSDVKAAMEEAFLRLRAEGFDGDILEPLEMQGVVMLGDSAVVVRARIKTLPGKQFGLGRRYTELVKDVMDERGIEIPFPHRQIVFPPGTFPEPAAEPARKTEG